MQMVKSIAEGFKRAKNFAISENKIIMWSKRSIFHANLHGMRHAPDKDFDIKLRCSNFEVRAV